MIPRLTCIQCQTQPAKFRQRATPLVFCGRACQFAFVSGVEGKRKFEEVQDERDRKAEELVNAIKSLQYIQKDNVSYSKMIEDLKRDLLAIAAPTNLDSVFSVIDPNESRILIRAVKEGDDELVRALLERPDIYVNQLDTFAKGGGSALMHAVITAAEKNKTTYELLLAHPKINLNQVDATGRTAFIVAVESLIEDYENEDDEEANIIGSFKPYKSLIEKSNMDVNFQSNDGTTALFSIAAMDISISDDYWNYLDYIVDSSNPHEADENWGYAIVRLLLNRRDIDLNRKNSKGETALMIALSENFILAQELIRDSRVNINLREDITGNTALMIAVKHGRVNEIGLLLEQSTINVNATDVDGNTAFMLYLKDLLDDDDYEMEPFFAFARHPDTDFFIKNKHDQTAIELTRFRLAKMLLFAMIAAQKYSPLTTDPVTGEKTQTITFDRSISKIIALRRLRNHLCEEISGNGNREDLLVLARFLGIPFDEHAVTKERLCLDISTLLSVATRYDRDIFEKQRAKQRAALENHRQKMLSMLESFKSGIEVYGGINTAGKSFEDLIRDATLLLDGRYYE